VAGNRKGFSLFGPRAIILAATVFVLFFFSFEAAFQPSWLTPEQGVFRMRRAAEDLRLIRRALEIYKLHHSAYPNTLKLSCEHEPDGGPPLLEQQIIIDPWGQSYIFEAGNPPPDFDMTRRLYSQGPPGQNKPVYWSP
jgi:Type II secretion system (T2SS), protein G